LRLCVKSDQDLNAKTPGRKGRKEEIYYYFLPLRLGVIAPLRQILKNKNAAAPYWGDGGRGSTQFQEIRDLSISIQPLTGPTGPP
jgi:hypothetical protein